MLPAGENRGGFPARTLMPPGTAFSAVLCDASPPFDSIGTIDFAGRCSYSEKCVL